MRARMALLDRGEEIDALTRLMAGTAEGRGGVAVLEGPAGIGKTALVRVTIELARDQGVAILRATGAAPSVYSSRS